MSPLRLALALVILITLHAIADDKPATSGDKALRQWMTVHNLTRAISFEAFSFWGGECTFYLGQAKSDSENVAYHLHQNPPSGQPTTRDGSMGHTPQIESLFTSKVYTLGDRIKEIPSGPRSFVSDASSYTFAKIKNGRFYATYRNGADTLYFEPIVRQQADSFTQVIQAIYKANKKR